MKEIPHPPSLSPFFQVVFTCHWDLGHKHHLQGPAHSIRVPSSISSATPLWREPVFWILLNKREMATGGFRIFRIKLRFLAAVLGRGP